MNNHQLSELLGVDVSDYGVVELTREKFQGIRLELYPEKTLHLIIHAVQFQQEVPKLQSLLRTEQRNLAKALSRANGGPVVIRKRRAKPKPKPIVKRKARKALKRKRVVDVAVEVDEEDSKLIGCRSVKSHPQQGRKMPSTPANHNGNAGGTPIVQSTHRRRRSRSSSSSSSSSGSASHESSSSSSQSPSQSGLPNMNSRSSSSSVILPNRDDNSGLLPAFKISSPARIALKSARTACFEQMKGWIAEIKAANPLAAAEKPVSAKAGYFKRKKENQKRRRGERTKLIRDNKTALIEMYGPNIFSRNFRMSRRDIKEVLGLKEEREKMDVEEGVGEFMAMVDEADELPKDKPE